MHLISENTYTPTLWSKKKKSYSWKTAHLFKLCQNRSVSRRTCGETGLC